eukprot:UN34303
MLVRMMFQRISVRPFTGFRNIVAYIPQRTFASGLSDDYDSFYHILDVFDANKDGKIQYEEFVNMTDSYDGITRKAVYRMEKKYFPTGEEELDSNQFYDLFLELFDENEDDELQHGEFIHMTNLLQLGGEHIAILEQKYFPTKDENLEGDVYMELMKEMDTYARLGKSN